MVQMSAPGNTAMGVGLGIPRHHHHHHQVCSRTEVQWIVGNLAQIAMFRVSLFLPVSCRRPTRSSSPAPRIPLQIILPPIISAFKKVLKINVVESQSKWVRQSDTSIPLQMFWESPTSWPLRLRAERGGQTHGCQTAACRRPCVIKMTKCCSLRG